MRRGPRKNYELKSLSIRIRQPNDAMPDYRLRCRVSLAALGTGVALGAAWRNNGWGYNCGWGNNNVNMQQRIQLDQTLRFLSFPLLRAGNGMRGALPESLRCRLGSRLYGRRRGV